jgi:hypothetical protein
VMPKEVYLIRLIEAELIEYLSKADEDTHG